MAKKSFEQLKAEAIAKGMQLSGQESYTELSDLLKEDTGEPAPTPTFTEPTPEEIKAIEEASKAKQEEIKKRQEEILQNKKKMYSEEEVIELFKKYENAKKKDEDEEEGERKHTVRISRFNNKFIVGLKNLNVDPYFPDLVITAINLFDEKTRSFVPHVTLIMDDASETPIPLETILKIKQSIQVPLLETKQKDISKKYGQIEEETRDDGSYGMKKTGNIVTGKQVMKEYLYVVQLPNEKEPRTLKSDVINW